MRVRTKADQLLSQVPEEGVTNQHTFFENSDADTASMDVLNQATAKSVRERSRSRDTPIDLSLQVPKANATGPRDSTVAVPTAERYSPIEGVREHASLGQSLVEEEFTKNYIRNRKRRERLTLKKTGRLPPPGSFGRPFTGHLNVADAWQKTPDPDWGVFSEHVSKATGLTSYWFRLHRADPRIPKGKTYENSFSKEIVRQFYNSWVTENKMTEPYHMGAQPEFQPGKCLLDKSFKPVMSRCFSGED